MSLRVAEHAAISDTGRQRRANEDSFLEQPPLFVVADGMGGAQAGEVASRMAAKAFEPGLDSTLAPESRLGRIVEQANSDIHSLASSDDRYQGMGTTLTAALVEFDEVTIAHVGDSRAYRFRADELTRLTKDHSLVGEMVRRGALSEEDAERHPQRSIITRALGPEAQVEVDVLTHRARPGDIYLLCSDGLTGMVDEHSLAVVLRSAGSLQAAVTEMVRRANENGGVDNITAVAFRLADSAEDVAESEGDKTVMGIEPFSQQTGGGQVPSRSRRRVQPRPQAIQEFDRSQHRRTRVWLAALAVVVVIAISIAGAWVGTRQAYFLGIEEHGLVALYRGTPYEGPMGLKLYQDEYVTSTPASELSPELRERLLDHRLRSQDDAYDLVRRLERGQLQVAGE